MSLRIITIIAVFDVISCGGEAQDPPKELVLHGAENFECGEASDMACYHVVFVPCDAGEDANLCENVVKTRSSN